MFQWSQRSEKSETLEEFELRGPIPTDPDLGVNIVELTADLVLSTDLKM